MFHLGWFLNGVSLHPRDPIWFGRERRESFGADLYVELARALERARFDYLLISDNLAIGDKFGGSRDVYLENAISTPRFDPLPYAAIIAAQTRHIGVLPTVSTSFVEPFTAARTAVTLDHISQGRVGLNLVTSSGDGGARNYGHTEHLEHDQRYRRAEEWAELLRQLSRSWEAESISPDIFDPVFADPTRVHPVNFSGEFFSSAGPLPVPGAGNGELVLSQAGGSPQGIRFAGRHADTVIAKAASIDAMKTYRAAIQAEAVAAGRAPDACKVLFIIDPILAETDEEARAKKDRLRLSAERGVRNQLALLSSIWGKDLSELPLDEPAPELTTNGHQGMLADFHRIAKGRTLREALGVRHFEEAVELVGTPDTVSARMGEIIEEVGGDGFTFESELNRRTLVEITDGLVPALQKRGLVRSEYAASTLRGHLTEF
ncbi:LLM class flavin-dependent oxidoreductase [Mycetocola tolaasinivorans]|uniref:LLM class flavin-dependent oxidoreductase n=1 Tax=Mycetocola tolaasinivorans TaxID=76635 RepID=A0A3L7ADQ6_9MICO|nr:NtaA/DmoA family FMN-dependent monooxygenase [Mycetocola tolaasinivorans]RLP77522.1 LLM class flavin-dependent oxidoreductase [Mycetocola tolaasinivorans]